MADVGFVSKDFLEVAKRLHLSK